MPRGIIQNQDLPGSLQGDIFVGFIEKGLKGLSIGMRELQNGSSPLLNRITF